jgi:hypothetical protein
MNAELRSLGAMVELGPEPQQLEGDIADLPAQHFARSRRVALAPLASKGSPVSSVLSDSREHAGFTKSRRAGGRGNKQGTSTCGKRRQRMLEERREQRREERSDHSGDVALHRSWIEVWAQVLGADQVQVVLGLRGLVVGERAEP